MFVMPNQRGLTWPIRCCFLDAGYLAFLRESRPNVTTIGSLMSIQGLSPTSFCHQNIISQGYHDIHSLFFRLNDRPGPNGPKIYHFYRSIVYLSECMLCNPYPTPCLSPPTDEFINRALPLFESHIAFS